MTSGIYTLSLHDALPIWYGERRSDRGDGEGRRDFAERDVPRRVGREQASGSAKSRRPSRSEEHTSELQSRVDLVCRLLLEKKKKTKIDCRHMLGNTLTRQ